MVGQLRLIGTKTNLIISSAAVFLSCFVLSFVASSLIIQPQGSKAATGLVLASTPTMTLSADGAAKTLTPNPTLNNGLASASSTLTASTNVPTGYNLSLSATSAGAKLGASSGTVASPAALAANTWGYALAKSGAVGITNGFDTSYAAPTPSTTSKWANPTTPTTIKNTTAAATNDQTNVYYGTKADITLPSGTYTSTVTYTATANITTIPTPTITSITPSTGTTAGGTNIQITGTGFTVNDQSVTTAVTIDGSACQNVTISSNTPTTGQDTIYCTTPAHGAATVNIKVTTWGGENTKTNGYRYKVPAIPMQEVTQETCPTTRTLAYDVRDNATYWIQKLADGRCWMLTNLAYGGGGTNTYNDVKIINLNSTNTGATYASPEYYIPPDANPTPNPTDPSTSTDGGVTNPQYGYRYNWCAAMGAQTGTSACANATTPAPDTSISICPSGWRLPTGGTSGEFEALNNAENSGSTSSLSGLMLTWLVQYGGGWNDGFANQGSHGYYWSSTQISSTNTYSLRFHGSTIAPGTYDFNLKYNGFAVRCILDIPAMQEMTIDECMDRRTVAYDARDNRTYFVQKMADGKCWMLTNLAYAGGGTNTYGDTKTINLNSTNTGATFTSPEYYVPTGANPTSYPSYSSGTTNYGVPSNSTDGGATNPQYGYLYNWCAAMGVQASTAACAKTMTPVPDRSVSICPSGWRLPTGDVSSEYEALNNAINGGSVSSTSGLLSAWLGQYSGFWQDGGFIDQGVYGYTWSSIQHATDRAYGLYFRASLVSPGTSSSTKNIARAVRCMMAEPVARTGDDIQTVTTATCPSVRTRVRDARDDATYWVQKMGDGRCWMLTNLAYGGGGTNTYGDTKSITNSNTQDYAQPYYMIPTGSNRTTGTTDPSTSTNGTGQYGYLYNWCAAMGVQTGTAACANATTPAPNTSISICPSGWRLPTSSSANGEFQQLTDAIGVTTNGSSGGTTGSTNLRTTWLAMYSGNWHGGFNFQGSYGGYWSSTQPSSYSSIAHNLNFGSGYVYPSSSDDKQSGFAVRCISN